MPDCEFSETTSVGEAFLQGLPYYLCEVQFAHLAVSFSKGRPRSSTSKPKSVLTHPSPLCDSLLTTTPDIHPLPAQPASADWMVEFGHKTHHTVCLQLFDVVLFTNHEHIWVAQHVSQRLLPAQTDGDVNQALSASLCRWPRRRLWASGPLCEQMAAVSHVCPRPLGDQEPPTGAGIRATCGPGGTYTRHSGISPSTT